MHKRFLESLGIIIMLFGMCVESDTIAVLIVQFIVIIIGVILFRIGLYLEKLEIERIKTNMRVEKIRRRRTENMHISGINRTYLKNQPLPSRENLYNKKTVKNREDDSFKSLLDSEIRKLESPDRPKLNDSNTR